MADGSNDSTTDQGLSLSDLTKKLHVPVPRLNSYVFHGDRGSFIVNRDFTPPARRLLEESEQDSDD